MAWPFWLIKTFVLASQAVPLGLFLLLGTSDKWKLAPLAMLPVLLVGIVRLYTWAFLVEDRGELQKWKDGVRASGGRTNRWCPCLDLFSAQSFGSLGLYFQSSLWQTLLVAACALRPLYFLSVVDGWGQSPCGRSSCSRDYDPHLLTSIPPTVYNPNGWFPQGDDHAAYDPFGVAEYTFCDFGDRCRWAEDNREIVVTFEKLAGGCQLNYKKPRDDQRGFASRRAKDYPNPAVGLEGGWSVCGRAQYVLPCPGNMRQETCGLSAHGLACNNTVLPAPREWGGKRVCATCSNYESAYKSLLLGVDGFPQWSDPETACATKDDLNPLCLVCPTRAEVLDAATLRTVVGLHVWLAGESLVCIVVVGAWAFAARAALSIVPTAEPVARGTRGPEKNKQKLTLTRHAVLKIV
jgi:hypothetical protein